MLDKLPDSEEAFGAAMDKLAGGSSFMLVVEEDVGSNWYDADVDRELKGPTLPPPAVDS